MSYLYVDVLPIRDPWQSRRRTLAFSAQRAARRILDQLLNEDRIDWEAVSRASDRMRFAEHVYKDSSLRLYR